MLLSTIGLIVGVAVIGSLITGNQNNDDAKEKKWYEEDIYPSMVRNINYSDIDENIWFDKLSQNDREIIWDNMRDDDKYYLSDHNRIQGPNLTDNHW